MVKAQKLCLVVQKKSNDKKTKLANASLVFSGLDVVDGASRQYANYACTLNFY